MERFSIAMAQLEPSLRDKEANIFKAGRYMHLAAEQGASLILFPELYLTGYSLGEEADQIAETLDGSSVQQVAGLAKQYNIAVIMGFAEQSDDGKHAYDSAFIVNSQGQVFGSYRKIHLFQNEKDWFLPGEKFYVVDFGLGPVGVLICYDLEFPEAVRELALNGAQWVAVCTGNMTPNQHLQETYIQARAAENRIWIALANRTGSEGALTFFGDSTVANPHGNLTARAGDQETLLFATLDLACANQARLNADYLADRKPQLYRASMKT